MHTPQSEAELGDIVARANGPLAIRGGATRGVSGDGSVLDVSALSGIELYEPGALTLVVGAGTPVADIETALASENQRLAFEPMDHRGLLSTTGTPTIGGVVAANISGPRRVQAGACRDHLLGVRFVDGHGHAIKNGGRVMKNVTGYDLVKLMCGSWGTLGVLSQVALKVLPRAETQTTLRVDVADPETAVRAMSQALGSPFEVTGAAFADSVLIRIEGFEASVRYRAGQLAQILGRYGTVTMEDDAEQSAAIWRGIRDVAAFHDQPGDVWRLSVKPGDAPGVLARLGAQATILDWGGGLIWAEVPTGTDLRRKLEGIAGHATLIRAPEETKRALGVFHPEAAPLAAISGGIRSKFDPRGILNPGMMG